MDLFWCISMTNNVKLYKKINGRVQTFRLSVFTMGGHWLTGALCSKRGKHWKNWKCAATRKPQQPLADIVGLDREQDRGKGEGAWVPSLPWGGLQTAFLPFYFLFENFCLQVASNPIFCCDELHIICCKCRPKVRNASTWTSILLVLFRCQPVLSAGRCILGRCGDTAMQKRQLRTCQDSNRRGKRFWR